MRFDEDAADEVVWSSAVAGDEAAFATIFRRHKDAVYVQCARRIGSFEGADDLVSVVFLEAWRCRERVRFINGSQRPWLLLVASHVAAKQVRSATRYGSLLRRSAALSMSAEPMIDVDARLDAVTLAPHLAAALSTLSRAEHDVIAMCDLAELTYSEAGDALGIPVGTVKSRLSRAHGKLRDRLGLAVAASLGLTQDDSLQEVK